VIRLIHIALLALLVGGCPKGTQPTGSVPSVVHRAQALADSDRMAAIRLLESYVSSPTRDPSSVPWALLWAGEQRRIGGDQAKARSWFETLAGNHPTHPLMDAARLGMALVDSETALSGNVLATLQLMGDSGVPDTMNADRYRILARVGADEGTPAVKVREYVRRAVTHAKADRSVEARVQRDLADLISIEEAQSAATTKSAEQTALERARQALRSRDFDAARTQAEQFLDTWPATAHMLEAKYIIRLAQAGAPATAGKVGVLLPLSGDYAPAANRIKATIELANQTYDSPLTLVFGDTKGTEEVAISELDRLVLEEGCVALLGPLRRTVSEKTATHAQALRVPMITLTHSGEPNAAGDFAFRGFLPMSQQIDALLDHVVKREGHRRFAIIHPRNSYGDKARDLFGAGVERRGGQVVSIVSYETDTRDFLPTARELSETTLDDVARADLMAMRAAAERRGRDPMKIKVPHLLSFDAIFIPDKHQRLVLLTSALAYEEFPIGQFRRSKEDRPIQLLGLNAWNDPALVQQGGRYVRDSVFVDAFHSGSFAPAVQRFVTLFEDAFSRTPGVTDALAWDAVRLLTPAVQDGRVDPEAIRAALLDVRITNPIAGGSQFGQDREVNRTLHVLTIKHDGIDQWMMGETGEGEEAE